MANNKVPDFPQHLTIKPLPPAPQKIVYVKYGANCLHFKAVSPGADPGDLGTPGAQEAGPESTWSL